MHHTGSRAAGKEKKKQKRRSLSSRCRTAAMFLMEETRLFGYHIPMIIKSKCFEMKAYPVHDCRLYRR